MNQKWGIQIKRGVRRQHGIVIKCWNARKCYIWTCNKKLHLEEMLEFD
jgi:hypothetical protein